MKMGRRDKAAQERASESRCCGPNFGHEPPFLLHGLSYMRESPPKRADGPNERLGGVDGGGENRS
jgi:hypothetical protein